MDGVHGETSLGRGMDDFHVRGAKGWVNLSELPYQELQTQGKAKGGKA